MLKFVAAGVILMCAVAAGAAELQVSAAASLTDALQQIGIQYQRRTGDRVLFNLAGSSMLARQIAEGAPVDVFISADEEKMDDLQRKGLILEATRKDLLSNALVIVLPADNTSSIQNARELADRNWKIALAEPNSVPAGIYARKYLQKIGLWTKLADHIVPTENVRGALAAVESGNVDAGIVYRTDAAISKRVRIAYQIPVKDAPKISYPAAVVRTSSNLSEAKRFVRYLSSPEVLSVFKRFGFLLP